MSDPGADSKAASGASLPGAAPPPVHTDRRHRSVGWQSRDVLRGAALAVCVYFALRFIWFANPLFLTAFLGVLFGLAVSKGVDRLERFRIPRGVGAGLIVASAIGLLVGFGAWVAPTLREQGTELRRKLPEAIHRVETWVTAHQGGVFGMVFGGLATEAKDDSALAANPAAAAVRDSADSLARPATVSTDTAKAKTSGSKLTPKLSGLSRYVFPFISSTIEAFAGFLLIVFMAIYIGADPQLYRRGLMALFPYQHRDRAGEVLAAIGDVLRRWLVTQLIAMVAIGTVTTVVLLALGVKAAFALGVIAGLLEFVPTIGPILSSLPAIAMGFLDSPEKAISVAIAYFGIQFIENHLLIPLLMKGGVDLPPALTILAQAMMALLFGFLGLMCAVPMLAAGMVTVKLLYVEGVVGEPATLPFVEEAPGDSAG